MGIIYNLTQGAVLLGGFLEVVPRFLRRGLHDGAGHVLRGVGDRGRHFLFDWTATWGFFRSCRIPLIITR